MITCEPHQARQSPDSEPALGGRRRVKRNSDIVPVALGGAVYHHPLGGEENPALLCKGVGNGAAACCLNGGQSGGGCPSEMDERTRSGDGGPADAAAAMYANVLSRNEAFGEARNEGVERGGVQRGIGIGNGVGEELQSSLLGQRAFFRKPEPFGLIFFKQGDDGFNSALL